MSRRRDRTWYNGTYTKHSHICWIYLVAVYLPVSWSKFSFILATSVKASVKKWIFTWPAASFQELPNLFNSIDIKFWGKSFELPRSKWCNENHLYSLSSKPNCLAFVNVKLISVIHSITKQKIISSFAVFSCLLRFSSAFPGLAQVRVMFFRHNIWFNMYFRRRLLSDSGGTKLRKFLKEN